MESAKKRVALYARVASGDAVTNLMPQEDKLRAYASNNNKKVVEVISEVASGNSIKRSGIDKILKLARHHEIDEVVMVSEDRLARDLSIFFTLHKEFENLGVKLVFLSSSGTD